MEFAITSLLYVLGSGGGHLFNTECFKAQANALAAEKVGADGAGGIKRRLFVQRRVVHVADQRCPIYLARAAQLSLRRVRELGTVGQRDGEAILIEPPAAGTPVHLEKLVTLNIFWRPGLIVELLPGDEHGTERKIDAGRQSKRRYDDPYMASFRERFYHPGTGGVTDPAMVECDTPREKGREFFPTRLLLLFGECQRVGIGEGPGDFSSDLFSGRTLGREDHKGSHICHENFCCGTRKGALDLFWSPVRERGDRYVLEGNRALVSLNKTHHTPEVSEPFYDFLGVGHTPAEEEHLGRGRAERKDELVAEAAGRLGDQLVIVDDEETWDISLNNAFALSFEGGDEYWRIRFFRALTSREPHPPALAAPLRILVVSKSAGRDCVDGLTPDGLRLDDEFEDSSFP